ncbi:MAG: 2-C-methyl-D-erythritol 2,4-cyclodiphosphate synthase, partial [Planctomycetes bacterium]|nr:2-C-methyl-D-erythritol 2,4-cyclodiphosphate synthase [Planctomycetota bacterium]
RPGEASYRFLPGALSILRRRRGQVVNIDCIIDLERVRLAPFKRLIRERLALLTGLDPARVNVKAKTAEGLGPVGRGRAVSAQAVVLIHLEEDRCYDAT